MKQVFFLLWLLLPTALLANTETIPDRTDWAHGLWGDVKQDLKNHYSAVRLGQTALMIGLAAPIANTNLDRSLYNGYQDDIRGSTTNDISDIFEPIGRRSTVLYMLPVYGLGLWMSTAETNSKIPSYAGEWSSRSLRTFILGLPQQVLLTEALGGERPEDDGSSHWDLISHGRAVSGHSFAGAVPFLSAAKMSDSIWAKIPLYTLSTFTGLSRINDEKHFPSQVILGWGLAYLAATSVDETIEGKHRKLIFTSAITPKGDPMLVFNYSF